MILIKNIGVNPSFESKLNFILGVIVIAFSWFQLSKPNITQLKTNAYAIPAGFIAGVLGGAYNTNGPPIVMYGVIKKWDPKEFKASLQAFFIFSNIYIIGSHFYYGNFTPIVIQYSVYTLAPAIASILLGNYLSKKIPAEKFNSMVYVLFMCLGLFLCYKSSF